MDLAKVRETEAIGAEYACLAGTVRSAASKASHAPRPDAAEWVVVYVLTVPCDADWRALKDRVDRYDPDRIPVLCVHGALGYPRSFETLIANLDRRRFQPWVALCPSGSRLHSVADYRSRNVADLQLRYGFEQMAAVAHSMGGLVSRAFILRHHARMLDDPVKVFVSISTPGSGVPSAASGIKRSPFVVPSWRDVEPGSRFIADLFFEDPGQRSVHRPLSEQVAFYLIFGVEDQTVPPASEVRWEAVRDARERWPLDYDHTAILQSAEASQLLNQMLERALP
jgi:pimeloyl-ACP methyl ester carboxylesterase